MVIFFKFLETEFQIYYEYYNILLLIFALKCLKIRLVVNMLPKLYFDFQ